MPGLLTPKMVQVKRLKPAEWNPRFMADERFQALCKSIQADPSFMELRPVLAQGDGTIYAGNYRYRACVQLGWERIPAVIADVPDDIARERMLRDNNQWGNWQEDDLGALLTELADRSVDLEALGFSAEQLDNLLSQFEPETLMHGEGEIGRNPQQFLEVYNNGTVRQIVLHYDVAEFEEMMRIMERVRATFSVDTNTAAITALLRHFDANHPEG